MRLTVDGSDVYAYTGSRRFDPARRTIVFVHGAANDHSVWTLQSRYFAHHGANIVAVDLPAHGRSGGTPLASVEAIADWLAAMLDAAGIERATLVGHSLGALAALECAARQPARVAKLALLGPAAPMSVSDVLLDAARRDDHVAYELITGWSYSPGRQLGGNPAPGMWMTGNALRLMERLRPGVLSCDLVACNVYANAPGCRCRSSAAPRCWCCTARHHGAGAQCAGDHRCARRFTRRQARRYGHAIMAEQPDAVLDALRTFV
jgi:pimeloyl-ACP methyl ester carboxylesterase